MRQVDNISLPQTREAKQEPYAQQVDTYVRPEQPLPSDVMQIINSIASITPEVHKYIARQEKKHRTFGEAVGAKLFADAKAIGLDGTPEEIKEAMRSGDLRGATAYNKHVQNGIVKMQFLKHSPTR